MTELRKIALLWNEASGWNEKPEQREAVEQVLGGSMALVVRRLPPGSDPVIECKALLKEGIDILAAAGGDGTLNAAACALVNANAALGVIPAGTLNHFARDLGVPLDARDAAELLTRGVTMQVDAAVVNGRVFINNSVLGLFPNYRSTREAWERRGFGRTKVGRLIAMLAGFLRVFWRMPHLTVQLEMQDRTHRLRTPFVLVGNNEHRMEGLSLGTRSTLNSGQLWVYVMRPCSRWGWLRLVTGLLLGRVPREQAFRIFQTSRLTIQSKRRRIGVGIDGEMVRMTAPLEYRSLPGALRVIAPPPNQVAE